MINFGVIGTNWITDSFIKSAHSTSQWRLTSVYSRTSTAATAFASKYSVTSTHTTIDSLCSDPNITAIYIASPNSLHHAHATAVLTAGKHAILEKPATSTTAELDELYTLARKHNVFCLEAYRHIHEANFLKLRDALPMLGTPFGASLTYATYSSRYDAVLEGDDPPPNIFSLDFSGGCLVDIGVYPIAFAVALWGAPVSSSYAPYICRTGVDAGGFITLRYDGFAVQINQSKCYKSSAPSEIYGEKGTITVNATTDITSVSFWDRKTKETKELAGEAREFNLSEEAEEMARIIGEGDREAAGRLEKLSRDVLRVTEGLRRENGIVFGVEREGKEGKMV